MQLSERNISVPSPEAEVPSALPDWPSLWDVVPEVDLEVTTVRGTLPAELFGKELIRNGPGKRDLAKTFFDGDGMLRSLRIDHKGRITLKTRYVRTPKYLAERVASHTQVRSAGTPRPGGILGNALRLPAAEGNTSVMMHGEHLLALHEGSLPFLVDGHSLMTLKQTNLDGAIRSRSGFSAHPHGDPNTNEVFNFGLEYGRHPLVHLFRMDAQGKTQRVRTTRAPYPTFLHDFGVSERKVGFFFSPLVVDLPRYLLGLELNFFKAIRFEPERGSELVLMDRDGGNERRIATEARSFMHIACCFDRGDELWVYGVRDHNWDALCADTADFRDSAFDSMKHGTLWRMRIDLQRSRVVAEEVSDLPMEFPQIDPRLATRKARYIYCAATQGASRGGLYRCLSRIDLETGAHVSYDFGPGRVVQEPLFIPRGPGETEGVLMAYVHNESRRATDVVILNAERVEEGPTCVIELPVNLGLTFHGILRTLPGGRASG